MLDALLGLLLLVSGAIGLGYQVLWSKFLLEFIGVSAYSYAIVLAAFMAGMALGSAALGPLADRVRTPLKLYAYLELGIGLYAVAYPALTEVAAKLYASSIQEGLASQSVAARVLVSACLLLVPTALMGGTIPALLRFAVSSQATLGRRTSQLYAANAGGAVIGSLAMPFVCMPWLGMRGSLMLLALGNLAVAGAALLLNRSPLARERLEQSADSPAQLAAATTAVGSPPLRLPLTMAAVAGILSFALEIAWTRFFAVVLGSSTYSFALMLAAFISGIALGSAALARYERWVRRPLVVFGIAQVIAGSLVLVTLPLYQYMPWMVDRILALFSTDPIAFYLNASAQLGLCYALMLPPTFCIGMSIPLIIQGIARGVGRVGGDAGRVFAANTAGNVIGALAGGLVLLPLLGVERLLRVIALGLALLGLLAIAAFTAPRERRWAAIPILGVLVATFFSLASPWNPAWFTLVAGRQDHRGASFAATARLVAGRQPSLFIDDPAANLLVITDRTTGTVNLFVNGKVDASSGADMPTQLLLGHLPLLLHPHAKDVMVIGLASGVTAGAVLRHDVASLDIVDIVGRMPEATRFFEQWNGQPLSDPRARLYVDDARGYSLYTDRRYDVIISEPSNPWVAGIGSLFSRDFYGNAARLLRPGGVYLQWLQAYEISDATLASVVRSYRHAFPWVYGFVSGGADLLLIGARQPLLPDWSTVTATIADPAIAADLRLAGVNDLGGLLFMQQLSPLALDWIAAQSAVDNTEDNLLLEYQAPHDLFEQKRPTLPTQFDARLRGGAELLLDYLRSAPQTQPRPRPLVDLTRLGAAKEVWTETIDRLDGRADRAALTTQLAERLVSGTADEIASFHADHDASIRLEALLDPAAGRAWIGALESAFVRAPSGEVPALSLALWIDLLAATGQVDQAKHELMTRFHGDLASDPDNILRACSFDRGPYCDQFINRSPVPADSPLARLREMRGRDRAVRTISDR